jgi:hypothetical protein
MVPAAKQMVSGALIVYEGQTVPTAAKPVIVWSVTVSARESYAYKYGDGSFSGASETFEVRLANDLPDAAINPRGVGIGYPILVASSTALADGKIQKPSTVEGAGGETVVIYRKEGSDLAGTGLDNAPVGYSCAKQESGGARFQAIPCSALEIHLGAPMPF